MSTAKMYILHEIYVDISFIGKGDECGLVLIKRKFNVVFFLVIWKCSKLTSLFRESFYN